jgi:hypothetical protein
VKSMRKQISRYRNNMNKKPIVAKRPSDESGWTKQVVANAEASQKQHEELKAEEEKILDQLEKNREFIEAQLTNQGFHNEDGKGY